MGIKRVFTTSAAMGAMLTASSTVSASPPYPGVLQAELELDAAPSCLVCHLRATGGPPANKPFAESLKALGLVGFNTQVRLLAALDDSIAAGTDSDGDGVGDVEELIAGSDPNDPVSTAEAPEPGDTEPADSGATSPEAEPPVESAPPAEPLAQPQEAGADTPRSDAGEILSSDSGANEGEDAGVRPADDDDGGVGPAAGNDAGEQAPSDPDDDDDDGEEPAPPGVDDDGEESAPPGVDDDEDDDDDDDTDAGVELADDDDASGSNDGGCAITSGPPPSGPPWAFFLTAFGACAALLGRRRKMARR